MIDSLEAKPAEGSAQKKVPKKTTPDKLESFISETRDYRQRQERFQQGQAVAHSKQHEERLDGRRKTNMSWTFKMFLYEQCYYFMSSIHFLSVHGFSIPRSVY